MRTELACLQTWRRHVPQSRSWSVEKAWSDWLATCWRWRGWIRVRSTYCAIFLGCLGDAGVQWRDKRTGAEITISHPKAIELYNSFMGGVHLSGQRVATYRRHIKSLTWYMQIYFHMFQLTAVQAFLLHRELHHDSKMTQHDFFLKLIDGLVGGHTYRARCGRPSAEPRVQDARFNRQLKHALLKLATSSKCAVHTRRVDTLSACSACNVRMCPYPCFLYAYQTCWRFHAANSYIMGDY